MLRTTYELHLSLGDDEMSTETYIQMEGEEITELELSTDELAAFALGTNLPQGFDLNVDLHSVDVDDVAPPAVNLSDAKHHASLLSSLISYLRTLYILVLIYLLIFKS